MPQALPFTSDYKYDTKIYETHKHAQTYTHTHRYHILINSCIVISALYSVYQ